MVGYSGGQRASPTYRSIKDHTEAVLVRFDPAVVSYRELCQRYWASGRHRYPGAGQYRSFLAYFTAEQQRIARDTLDEARRAAASEHDYRTPIEPATDFYRAEEYHQQYYFKTKP